MIHDPIQRGRAVAALYTRLAPSLFRDLEESGLLPEPDPDARDQARGEWEYFALYACVRGLVAAGGFNRESGQALDAFHETVLEDLRLETPSAEELEARRATVAERYAEYGELGQKESRGGDPNVARALGAAAARHMVAPREPTDALAELVGSLHEALVDGVGDALEQGA